MSSQPGASMISRSKRLARRAVDRVMQPYVDQIVQRPPSAAAPAHAEEAATVDVPSELFHMALHELRTIELERLRGSYERVVSVGASGGWYFDWFEQSVGPVVEHVGVEAFEPEPDDLPRYVRWIATTADRFDGIDDGQVDVVFAGQTTEHLWADELVGFLIQARRVVREDGFLVLDSPNRLVTEHLLWSHGGHTVELSPAEITEVAELAGFRVESLRGLWRCRFGDQVLQLEEGLDDGARLVRRIVDGPTRPDDCFVWWVVARPAGPGDPVALERRVRELYEAHWPTRVSRGMWPGPGFPGPHLVPGAPFEATSLPFMLAPGRWRLEVAVADGAVTDLVGVVVTLELPGHHVIHRFEQASARCSGSSLSWEFDLDVLVFALAIHLTVEDALAPVRLAMPLGIAAAIR